MLDSMIVDLKGKVRNTKLPYYKPLQPLFEAISNSFDAIADANLDGKGAITIELIRETSASFKEDDNSIPPVTGFIVTDNGVGFNDDNMNSFMRAESSYKTEQGGKGVGRFLWLKAFRQILISSTFFDENGTLKQREFEFVAENNCRKNFEESTCTQGNHETSISLLFFKEVYKAKCPKGIDVIAQHVIDHFCQYFKDDDICPQVVLHDSVDTITLNVRFKEAIAKIKKETFELKQQSFTLMHLLLTLDHTNEHLVSLCAHKRSVETVRVRDKVPNLESVLQDDNGKYIYHAYIESSYFDEHVNNERTQIFFPQLDTSDIDFGVPSRGEILEIAFEKIQTELAPLLEKVQSEKQNRFDEFIDQTLPQLRYLKKKFQSKYESLSPSISDSKLEKKLREFAFDIKKETEDRAFTILDEPIEAGKEEEKEEEIRRSLLELTEVNRSDLAEYIVHRKVTLKYIEDLLARQADDSYEYERVIHNAIFPQYETSDSIPFENHNLWLLDDRLAYHTFLGSDQAISSMNLTDADSGKKCDIVIFDKVTSFTQEQCNFTSITIIEFKRPMRNSYPKDDNPIDQVYGYIEDIRAGKAQTHKGRIINISNSTPFFVYIVCDITPNIAKLADRDDFLHKPYGSGFFRFHQKYNAYIEILLFNDMVDIAKKRNAVFFDKLGLPQQ